jgi:two-component system chemotaxis response regulator CheY
MMGKIMIVEDDVYLSELYRMVLEHAGFEIIGSASNGVKALALLENGKVKPDLVIMDYRMPVKNGLETAREMRAKKVGSLIILATADHAVVEGLKSNDVDEVMEKPFTMEVLITAAKRMVKLRSLSS